MGILRFASCVFLRCCSARRSWRRHGIKVDIADQPIPYSSNDLISIRIRQFAHDRIQPCNVDRIFFVSKSSIRSLARPSQVKHIAFTLYHVLAGARTNTLPMPWELLPFLLIRVTQAKNLRLGFSTISGLSMRPPARTTHHRVPRRGIRLSQNHS